MVEKSNDEPLEPLYNVPEGLAARAWTLSRLNLIILTKMCAHRLPACKGRTSSASRRSLWALGLNKFALFYSHGSG